jgi:hypothetical protein
MDFISANERPVRRRLVAVGLVGAGLVAGGTLATLGVASASGTASPSASSTAPPTPDQGRHGFGPRGFGRMGGMDGMGGMGGLHGTETVVKGTNTYVTLDNQRGTVTANDGSTITVKSVDGFTATYSFDANSRIGKNHARATIADLKVGDTVAVLATARAGSNPVVVDVRDGLAGRGPDGDHGLGGPGMGGPGMGGPGMGGPAPTGAPTGGTSY